jgi:hypothetical protein
MNIDKNIEIPLTETQETAKKMNLGDSVLFTSYSKARGLRDAIQKQKFTAVSRSVPGGIRIWKVKQRNTDIES